MAAFLQEWKYQIQGSLCKSTWVQPIYDWPYRWNDSLASAIILVPAGILNDRFGSKRIISIGLFLVIPALLARSLLTGEHMLLVSAFIAGMSLAVVSATFMPFLANNSRP